MSPEIREKVGGLNEWKTELFARILKQLDRDARALRKGEKPSALWRAGTHELFERELGREGSLNGELNEEVVSFLVEEWIVFLNGEFLDRLGLLLGAKRSKLLEGKGLSFGKVYSVYYKLHAAEKAA